MTRHALSRTLIITDRRQVRGGAREGGDSRGGRTPKIFLRKTISLASFGKKGSQKIRGHHAQLLHMMQNRPAPDSTSFPTLASNRRIGTNPQQRIQSRLGAATNRFTVPQIPDKLCNNNRRGPTPPPPWQDLGLGATCSEIHYQRTEEETSRLAASTDENGKRGGGLERVRAARKSPGEMVAALPKTREAKPI